MKLKIGFLVTLFHLTITLCDTQSSTVPTSTTSTSAESSTIPSSTIPSWVLVTRPGLAEKEGTENDEEKLKKAPKIYSMKVDTNVTNRFATTTVTSKVKNSDEKAQEATFSVVLPETAYIAGFVMEIDGKKYEAYVQEKEEAKKTYDNAVSSGQAAAHVAVSARDSNRFTVSVNIEPESKATFFLTYEELLKRQNGQYDIVINLHPGQPIKDLEVQVNINETRPLTFVKAPSLRSGNEISKNDEKLDPQAEIEHIDNRTAKVTFKPDIERQNEFAKTLGTKEGGGLAGQFIVQYDVERDPHGGEVLVSDGYFIHFFAPSELKPLPKHVIFVLDTSGSMYGTRIAQLKEAMKSILDQLKNEDTFNIIEFNSVVKVWNIPKVEVQYQEGDENRWYGSHTPVVNRTGQTLPGSFEVSEDNIKHAKDVVEKLVSTGGTDISTALDIALKLYKESKQKDERQPIIMFLTDGEPTEGETNTETIVTKISKENTDEVPLFSLSFGSGADRSFLEKLSLRNQGFARHIYEGADAALQLESFYKYISSPLLSKVDFKYDSRNTSQVTKTQFPILFDGSELVVAGKYPSSKPSVPTEIDPGFAPPFVTCWFRPEPVEYRPTIANPIGSLEKHWAYLTLKQILDQRDAADNKTELTKKALDLALKYSFVTPVTSLVVVKPNDTKAEANPEDASKADGGRPFYGMYLTTPYPSFAFRPNSNAFGAGGAGLSGPIPLYSPMAALGPVPRPIAFDSPVLDSLPGLPTSTRPVFSTTTIPVVCTSNDYDDLNKDLPWLDNIFNAGNGTVNLPQGQFLLGSIAPLPEGLPCQRPPLNETGTCVLLKDCPQVHKLLTDLATYSSQFFCPIVQSDQFAGVCCPIKKEDSSKTKGVVAEPKPIP